MFFECSYGVGFWVVKKWWNCLKMVFLFRFVWVGYWWLVGLKCCLIWCMVSIIIRVMFV